MFEDPNIVGVRVLIKGERVDVADLGFICDGDELLVVKESDLLMEASRESSNTDNLELDDVNSLASDLENLATENAFPLSSALTKNQLCLADSKIDQPQLSISDWLTLNVGGTKFVTCRSTIEMKVLKY